MKEDIIKKSKSFLLLNLNRLYKCSKCDRSYYRKHELSKHEEKKHDHLNLEKEEQEEESPLFSITPSSVFSDANPKFAQKE